jgi:phosphatidylserine/phosphatidylglycerophosphate/cardiolipin synthase-like enzyme
MNFLRLPQLQSSTALPRLPGDVGPEALAAWRAHNAEERLAQAYKRISASELRSGNSIHLLRNGAENYPAWLEAIRSAREVIHFENFIVADDETGRAFASALMERAGAGVTVRVLYDWLGSTGRAFPPFWTKLKAAGVDVRVFNPPRFTAPFWVRRDHRKLITVDGAIPAWRSAAPWWPISIRPSRKLGRRPAIPFPPRNCPIRKPSRLPAPCRLA